MAKIVQCSQRARGESPVSGLNTIRLRTNPFGLSLSKPREHFDKLSANGLKRTVLGQVSILIT